MSKSKKIANSHIAMILLRYYGIRTKFTRFFIEIYPLYSPMVKMNVGAFARFLIRWTKF